MVECSVEGCEKPKHCRGWCTKHYQRWLRHQNPTAVHGNTGREGRTTKHATTRPTVRNLAWAAGFLEGEGCFKLSGRSVRVTATQVNYEPVSCLLSLFGGHTAQHRWKDERYPKYWRWSIFGARARGVMMTLYPLMSARRQEQIRNALC